MKKYVGNCSDAFDWDQIISKFDERQVSHKKYEEGSTASKEIDDAWAESKESVDFFTYHTGCLLYTSPSPRDSIASRMPSSA